jgi:hypothetical protein
MAAKQRPHPARLVGCTRCDAWEARYHELVRELLTMKREGFGLQTAPAVVAEMRQLPAVVRKAISDVASPGDPTWRHLERQAWEMIGQEMDEGEIAAQIGAGEAVPL